MTDADHLSLFTTSLAGGGAERIMVMLANAFSRHGLRVELVLCQARGPYLDDIAGDIRVVDLKAPRIVRALPGLVRHFRRERPLRMLSFLTAANCLALAARAMTGTRTRLVISERNHLDHILLDETWYKAAAFRILTRRLYPQANAIVGISEGVSASVSRQFGLPPARVHTVHNPVDYQRVRMAADRPFDHPWLTHDQVPVILGAGRLTHQKDFETLIRAFERLRRVREARLVILGEGEARPDIESQARQAGLTEYDFTMPGFVANPWQWMNHAAVFVLSSRFEGFGNVIVEALACGTPVVSTDCPSGPREILDHGRYGRLVPVGDADAMSQAICRTLDETVETDVLRNRARTFSIEHAVTRYLKLLFPESPAG